MTHRPPAVSIAANAGIMSRDALNGAAKGLHTILDTVQGGALTAAAACPLVNVDGGHGRGAELQRGDREDTRTAPHVESAQPLDTHVGNAAHHHRGSGMVSRPE